MDDITILEAVERYILGQMTPDERVYFEQLRKSNPEIDQAVVEHTFFLQQVDRYDSVKNLKATLNETHLDLAGQGLIQGPEEKESGKLVQMFRRYKRTAMIAAGIAGITALTMSAFVWSFSPNKPANRRDLELLSRDMRNLGKKVQKVENQTNQLEQSMNVRDIVKGSETPVTPIEYTSGGTGFMIDSKGYLVTNAHVVSGARHVAVQTGNGADLQAIVVYINEAKDMAILKITDKRFKSPGTLPYGIRRSGARLAEPIFTLGYPRNDIVYGSGYIAARTGYDGDTLACQIAIAANRGNSGSPIINKNGEVIGVISNKQNTAEGAVFAIHSKYIFEAVSDLQKRDTSFRNVKVTSASNIREKDRVSQVEKLADYVYMVKVN